MAASEFVTLRAGITCPVTPILLMIDLESRGFKLAQDGDVLVVQPYQQLTADDCTEIRRWKAHLLALLTYTPQDVH